MTDSLYALTAFAAWTLLLSGAVFSARLPLMLIADFRINSFPSGSPHGPDRYWRLNRAHANAVENLPVFAAIVLIGKIIGESRDVFEHLALIVPAARIAQSALHVSSNHEVVVTFRFICFFAQWAAMMAMIVLLLTR
jgi:uncharacterized MAPEG superfamily protein